jgi:hypothetical protein
MHKRATISEITESYSYTHKRDKHACTFSNDKGPVFKTGPFVRKRFNTALEQTILGISQCLGAD